MKKISIGPKSGTLHFAREREALALARALIKAVEDGASFPGTSLNLFLDKRTGKWGWGVFAKKRRNKRLSHVCRVS